MPEQGLVLLPEKGLRVVSGGKRNFQGRVLPRKPQKQALPHDAHLARGKPFGRYPRGGFAGELFKDAGQVCLRQGPQQLTGGEPFNGGPAHAVGAEQTRVGRHQHAVHAQQCGHPAGVLPAGPAEGQQGVAARVVASLHRHPANGVGHPFVGNL